MWAEVVNVIAKALDTFDQAKVHDAIKADRDNIKDYRAKRTSFS